MVRDYFQDVTPPNPNRSVRNIPMDRVERPMREPVRPYSGEMAPPPPPPPQQQPPSGERPPQYDRPMRRDPLAMPPKRKNKKWLVRWGIAVIAVIVLIVIVMFATWNTSVTITPRSQTVTFDESSSFTAYPQGTEGVPAGALTYTMVERTLEEAVTAEASGTARAEDTASGSVTIFNEYSNDAVRLIKNTRFETSDGRIYRIRESVNVPGRSGDKPGSIAATVYADEPGERFNITGAAAFTLPGLKTSSPDMFAKVYARTENGISGGFIGDRPQVAEATLVAARTSLRAKLETRAKELTKTDVPQGSVAFPDSTIIAYTSLPPVTGENGAVSVREQAVVRMAVLNTAEFARIVGKSTVADADTAVVMIKDPSTMAARLVSDPNQMGIGPIDIALSGRATLVWQVDTAAFAHDLSGRDKGATQTILAGYPGIVDVVVSLRPFWRGAFPADSTKIKVVVEEPKE